MTTWCFVCCNCLLIDTSPFLAKVVIHFSAILFFIFLSFHRLQSTGLTYFHIYVKCTCFAIWQHRYRFVLGFYIVTTCYLVWAIAGVAWWQKHQQHDLPIRIHQGWTKWSVSSNTDNRFIAWTLHYTRITNRLRYRLYNDKVITLLHETHETDSMKIYLSRHTKQIPWRYIYLPVINVLGLGLNLWIFSISLTQWSYN